jgi:hypothetical protein
MGHEEGHTYISGKKKVGVEIMFQVITELVRHARLTRNSMHLYYFAFLPSMGTKLELHLFRNALLTTYV